MPRKRNPENKGLPTRWRFTRNAYYYQVPLGMEAEWDGKRTFKLGNTLPTAYRVWADRIPEAGTIRTIGQLLDRYAMEIVPLKAITTQRNEVKYIRKLKAVFGNTPIKLIEPKHIYSYIDKSEGKVLARKETKLLSHAYTKAVEWGYLNRHPFKFEVRIKNPPPRSRYVTDAEILECLSLPSPRSKGSIKAIQAYIRLKLLTGLRRGDLLRLKLSDLREDGIHVTTNKTGKPIIYEWSAELRECITLVKSTRPVQVSQYLFCTRRGRGYINERTGEADGWASMWQRFMDRVLAETNVKERFTEHDLRAKAASDADNLEHARALLAHVDSKITQRVYRRKPEVVKPLR